MSDEIIDDHEFSVEWGIHILEGDPDFETKIIHVGDYDTAPKRADYFIRKSPETRVLLHRMKTTTYSQWIEDHE